MLDKYLEDIGLNDKESKVYLALLEFESASVMELAKKTSIKRPTVYVVLESLAKKGLVSETTVGKKTNYYAEPPERLETFLERKIVSLEESKRVLKDLVPQLKSISREHGEKPVVKYFEGKEGIFASNEEALKIFGGDQDPMYAIYNNDLVDEIFSPEELRRLRGDRVSRNIKAFSIYTSKDKERPSDSISSRIKIDKDKYPILSDITVYKDLILISILGKKISAIMIKNGDVAETIKSIFKLVFDTHKR